MDVSDEPQTASGSAKGKTTGIKSTVSRTNNTSFDTMGRLLTSQQITDGQTYDFGYSYNLSGVLMEETYPSTRKVKNTLNADGELSQVQSKKNTNSGYWTYADSFSYNSAGAVTKTQLGNGRWETAQYDTPRLQVTEIGLGTTDSTQNLLKLEFKYTGPGSGTDDKNNGSMREQKITVPAVGSNSAFTATQAYTYDDLNRLESATETISSTQKWKQTFQYDRFGNRRFNTTGSNTTTLGSCSTAICNPTISTTNNQLSSAGYDYDENGSLIEDAEEQRFGYDAENHQIAFFNSTNTGSTPDATYHYDGEGKRVKKIVGTEVTILVYDASGQLAAEYATQIETANPQVSYLTTDHLGSLRIITAKNGSVTSRKDFGAFGDEITTSERVGGATGNGYNPPNIRQDYTGYQNDDESGLEFAQARYYNNQHGRFTSVDPLNESASTGDPQTFNRYSYVSNDPLNLVDPSGMTACSAEYSYTQCGGGGGFWGGAGGFGDDVAYYNRDFEGMPRNMVDALGLHYERMSNSQAGNGFVTNAQAEAEAAVATFLTYYDEYPEDDPSKANAHFNEGAITVYQFLPRIWQIINGLRDGSAAMHDSFATIPVTDKLNALSQAVFGTNVINTESETFQDTETGGLVAGILVPGPGGKAKAVNLLSKPRNATRVLKLAQRLLGKGYTEIAPGVFRNGSRQFRMTSADLVGKHGKLGPHVHFESLNRSGKVLKNHHVPLRP